MFSRHVILPAVLLSGACLWVQASATTSIPSSAATAAQPLAALQKQAATGNSAAQVALGQRLIDSKDPVDKAEAVAPFRDAAAQGNTDAERALGGVYMPGDGIEQDVPTGLK